MSNYERKPDAMPAFVPAMGTFHGRVSREPEEINLQNGSYTKIGLVSDCFEADYENDAVVETTFWFLAMLPHGTGRDLAKGDTVAVSGQMKHKTYTGRDGQERSDWTVWANGHKLMSRKQQQSGGGAAPAGAPRGRGRRFQTEGPPPPQEAHTSPMQAGGEEADIPF